MRTIRTLNNALFVIALIVSLAPGAAADTRTATYWTSLGTQPGSSVIVCHNPDPDCPVIHGDIGGAVFAPNGQVPIAVRVDDLVSPSIPIIVTQDTNGDGALGPGDLLVSACIANHSTLSLSGFSASRDTLVFIQTVGVLMPGCLVAAGATGSVTLTTA